MKTLAAIASFPWWPAIASGLDVLIAAPTGSGKTLAAFLVCIDRLFREAPAPDGGDDERTRVVYVSPLKALAADIQQNLQTPLAEIRPSPRRWGSPRPTCACCSAPAILRRRHARP